MDLATRAKTLSLLQAILNSILYRLFLGEWQKCNHRKSLSLIASRMFELNYNRSTFRFFTWMIVSHLFLKVESFSVNFAFKSHAFEERVKVVQSKKAIKLANAF